MSISQSFSVSGSTSPGLQSVTNNSINSNNNSNISAKVPKYYASPKSKNGADGGLVMRSPLGTNVWQNGSAGRSRLSNPSISLSKSKSLEFNFNATQGDSMASIVTNGSVASVATVASVKTVNVNEKIRPREEIIQQQQQEPQPTQLWMDGVDAFHALAAMTGKNGMNGMNGVGGMSSAGGKKSNDEANDWFVNSIDENYKQV